MAYGDLPQRRAGARGLERGDVNYNAASLYCPISWRFVMIRARFAAAATIVGVSFVVPVFAQDPPPAAPPMRSVLAGKKFTPPVRGEATIDIVKTPTKREGTTLVTKIVAKNTSAAPIAR